MLIALRIVAFTKSEFAGHSPNILGAVPADLLAVALAGHIVHGDRAATDAPRAKFGVRQ